MISYVISASPFAPCHAESMYIGSLLRRQLCVFMLLSRKQHGWEDTELPAEEASFSHAALYLSCILINLSFWQFYPFNPTLVSFQTTRLHNTSVYVFVLKPVLPENDRQCKGKSSNRHYYTHQGPSKYSANKIRSIQH